ncbi:MAG: hypothetical protein QME52_08680 [Bacteroidota bacterium]|nr:hypothetical protein [Bacteroidota bacterium]
MKKLFRNYLWLMGTVVSVVITLSMFYWTGCQETPDVTKSPVETTAEAVTLSKSNPQVQEIMAVQSRHSMALMSKSGVVGTGVGADVDGKPVLLILTERPDVPNLPTIIDGIRTRVDVVGKVVAMAKGYKKTYRPVPDGVSVGNALECAAGTIGCTVFKGSARCMLSNNHVLARENTATIGERINQPGRYDAKPICAQTEQVAKLTGFVPINFSGCDNEVDCAIAEYTTASVCSMVDNLYTPSSTVVTPTVGLAVKKVGRTTGLTRGKITGINVTITVDYGASGMAKFVNQIYVAGTFIKSGDSGSLMVTETGNNPVGLCFAGGSSSAFANPIGAVLYSLGVTICSE